MGNEGSHAKEKSEGLGPDIIAARFMGSFKRMLFDLPPQIDLEAEKQQLITHLETRAKGMFPEFGEKFTDSLEQLRNADFTDRNEMLKEMASLSSNILLSVYSPAELETRLRENAITDSGWVGVNEALSYAIAGSDESLSYGVENGGVVTLHVPNNFTRTPFAERRLFIEGLRTLAQHLKTKPELQNVRKVVGDSWIVYDNPDLLPRLGFTLGDVYEEKKRTITFISREDFIARYGS